ncbi:E3 SUMO-protein ligase ZBED1 [Callorhinchus milii]|uniref:Zinc finger BED-type containing 1 n=1 Tax=Callorhinchus milii TaxID=7868 RepID=A0A4W3JKX7_CALMI|nr:E3 SUMO-protein ligase ZBED1 [Callorhinchus milii]XP_042190068.1 E3 SUMO-protein ligase ZBED1 [Callorhinchus milii]|eukprot:gi/632947795/ref/XP_007889242.1/ PREDICTED: zinc finger BED domain-containing protein 1 [Callorhinchus milii]
MEFRSPESSTSDLKLVCHPRAKSKVWKYFGFDTDAEGCILQWKKIYCRVCRAQIAYSGNTSNLSYHLEKNHPSEFHEVVRSNTEPSREPFPSSLLKLELDSPHPSAQSSYGQDSRRHQELTLAITAFICDGLHPAGLVEEPTFRKLLRAADPRFELPGRRYFMARAIPERYHSTRAAVEKELAAAAWCGLTAELWTSHSRGRRYTSLTAHFLGGRGGGGGPTSFVSKCLSTFEVAEDGTPENLAHSLAEQLREWGVSQKALGATTVGGSEGVAGACSLLSLPVHLPCLGHVLNTALGLALQLPKLCSLLLRFGRLAGHLKWEPRAMCPLGGEKPRPRGPVSDWTTWGGAVAMLRGLGEQRLSIAHTLAEDPLHGHLVPDPSDWISADALVSLLEPFEQAAEMLAGSGSKYPMLSAVRPLLHVLLGSTLRPEDSDSPLLGAVKETVAARLSEAYRLPQELELFLDAATFLDPRYKKVPFLSPARQQQLETRLLEEALTLSEKASREGDWAPEEPPLKKMAPAPSPRPWARCKAGNIGLLLAEMFGQAAGAGGDEDEDAQDGWHARVVEELNNYKWQKVPDLSQDPLRWWWDRAALFPTLSRLLPRYWCVPATSVPAERLFTGAGELLDAKRNQLVPAEVDQLLFLYENSRADREATGEDE